MAASNATPMMALDAVILDIETTGLDPAKARALEIGAVRLIRGQLDPSASFRHLVRPDTPVPADTVRIHGIDEAVLSDARPFAEVWPELADFVGDAVVIGQSIGFDLAVLKRECERAGLAWVPPHTLDTRLLAEVAEPELADYSLDALAAWLGVEVTDRHSALGDARIAGRVFVALVPKLREGRIRTLGEATQACRTLTAVLDRQHRAGWVEVGRDAEPGRRGTNVEVGSTAIPTAIAFATSCARRLSFLPKTPPLTARSDRWWRSKSRHCSYAPRQRRRQRVPRTRASSRNATCCGRLRSVEDPRCRCRSAAS